MRAHRVAVHLAVRERVLGLYPGAHQDAPARLRHHARGDDAQAADDVLGGLGWRRGTLGVGTGVPLSEFDLTRLRARRVALEALADADSWHAMLLLALVGTHPFIGLDDGQRPPPGVMPGLDRDTWRSRHAGDATLSFLRLVLLRSSIEELAAFRAAHPAFLEVAAIVGEAELARGRLVSADEALGEALAEFPSLVPALALRGDLRQRMEDFDTALALYDSLLQRLPDHREALLGRLKCLGFLGRHADAVVAADRMLDLGTWYIGEAYYWRAWNLFNLRRLDEARASVDDARRLMVNADVEYLGGVIAFRQNRLDDAARDFDSAVALESRHCEAHFDRAALRLVQRTWEPASIGFDEAYECHAARTPTYEQRIADAREARLDDDARLALVAKREQALREHRHQLGWARYNAAVAYANVGREAIARTRVDDAVTIGGPAGDAARDLLAQLRVR
jgi:tetratricopeptide (TPR) repeat protein